MSEFYFVLCFPGLNNYKLVVLKVKYSRVLMKTKTNLIQMFAVCRKPIHQHT